MSEFQEKVQELKQNFSEHGFSVDDSLASSSEPPKEETEPNVETSETQESPPSEEHFKPRKAKRKLESFQNRIERLTFENNVREAQNRELLARVQEQERLLAEKQQLLEQNEQYKNAYYENDLETRGNAILNELKVAKEEGDVEKEVTLSKELAKVEAAKSTHNFYKAQLRNQPQPDYSTDAIENKYYPSYPQESLQEEPENEAYENWLEKNQWADPNSPTFSPRLRQEIDNIDAEFADLLRFNGQADKIGTPEYFSALDNVMKERYSVQSSARKENQMQKSTYNVAPVSRNGSSMADQYMASHPNNTRQSTPLTEAEYRIARNLQIKLPNGKYLTGADAVKRYAEAKHNFAKSQDPNRPFSLTID